MNKDEKINRKWQKLKSKARPCPKCNSKKLWLNSSHVSPAKRWWVECSNCHWCARSAPFIRWSIHLWNVAAGKEYRKMLLRIYGNREVKQGGYGKR